MEWVDLHTHSTASDGTDSPSALVKKAADLGLAAVAVTDHDCVSGLEEACEAGIGTGMEVVRGCELSSASPYGEMHILGLWLPRDTRDIDAALGQLRGQRTERNRQVLGKLQGMGIRISYDEVLEVAQGSSVGRPHIAQLLLRKGYVKSIREAFDRLLGKQGKAYVPRTLWPMDTVVSLLARSGATVCAAHPRLLSCADQWLEDTLGGLKKCGLQGIEVYHSEYSPADERFCLALAKKLGLLCTGGSDYHGAAKPNVQLGWGRGNLRVSAALVDSIKKARKAQGLPV